MGTTTNHAALIVSLPSECKGFAAVQEIRKSHDPAFERWMPHINIIYPFVTADQATFQRLHGNLSFEPFELNLSRFGIFQHSSSSSTVYLGPDAAGVDKLQMLHQQLTGSLPSGLFATCDKQFVPHLTLAKYAG